jgi:hypothetical protein
MNARQLVVKRWGRLAFSTALSLAGLAWFCVTFGVQLPLQLAGLVVATIVAVVARARRSERRWPAAIALVCAAPMAQLVLRPEGLWTMLVFHGSTALVLVGSAATVVTALIILFAARPPPTPDPVARAVAQPRSSE